MQDEGRERPIPSYLSDVVGTSSWPCESCQGRTSVLDSRSVTKPRSVRRRRICLTCGTRFTTYETLEKNPQPSVKRDALLHALTLIHRRAERAIKILEAQDPEAAAALAAVGKEGKHG